MAGAKSGKFKELISPFLRSKISDTKKRFGESSAEYNALARQYLYNDLEEYILPAERRRHYECEVNLEYRGKQLAGVERLYRNTILIEPTTVCAAHCRWCLRGQYPVTTMGRDDIVLASRYIGSQQQRGSLDEVLITGGDPLMSLPLLEFTISALQQNAPNIKIIRIGSRVIFQDPARVNDQLLGIFKKNPQFRFEIGLNVNHPVEFWPESTYAIQRLRSVGVRLYNQNPLLKGVNDNPATLIALYRHLRRHDIDAHYLFHAIPMRGMRHHRTSVARGLDLATQISASGEFSGRSKPLFAILSDIGKIVLYHDSIIDHRKEDNALLIRSGFRFEDRMRWNPSWVKPDSAMIDDQGFLMTWYLDGDDVADAGIRCEMNAAGSIEQSVRVAI